MSHDAREAVTGGLSELADHPKRAFIVKTTVFLPETTDTSVRLSKGELLFVLTDKGLDEAPHSGPDDVHISTEHFGCWPVVAIPVRAVHAERWRKVTKADCARMMTRVREALAKLPKLTGEEV